MFYIPSLDTSTLTAFRMNNRQTPLSLSLNFMTATQTEKTFAPQSFMTPRAAKLNPSSPPSAPRGNKRRLRTSFKDDNGIMPMFLIPLFDEPCETEERPFKLTMRQRLLPPPIRAMQSLSVQSSNLDETSHSQASSATSTKSNKSDLQSMLKPSRCKMVRRLSESARAA